MMLIARKRPSRSYRMRFQKNNKGASIMMHSHQTAPTQFVEANSIRFAYRRFGKTGGVPLVFSQHYIGTMDYWDPTVTDGLAPRPGVDPVHQPPPRRHPPPGPPPRPARHPP